MAEDGEFDPNANVPLWINIVVPIALFIIFVLVLVWLFFTDKEIPAHIINRWLQKFRNVKQTKVDDATRDLSSIERTRVPVKEVEGQTAGSSDSFNIEPTNETEIIAGSSKTDNFSADGQFKNYGAIIPPESPES